MPQKIERCFGHIDGDLDLHAVEHEGRVKRSLASDVGADPQPVGLQELISCPALKIGEAGGKGVPGGMIGLGAESQKKSPFDNSTCGTKK